MSDDRWSGSLLDSAFAPTDTALQLRQFTQSDIGLQDLKIWGQSNVELIPPIKEFILTCDAVEDLVPMYKMLYPPINIIHVHRVCRRVQKVSVCRNNIIRQRAYLQKLMCISPLEIT